MVAWVDGAVRRCIVGLFLVSSLTAAYGQAPANHGKRPTDSLSGSASLVTPKSEAADKTTPRLLWVRSKYGGPEKDVLRECEKLTVAEYRKRGVEVVELASADLDKWREGEGKPYAKASKYLQYVAYARGQKVHAVGGLNVTELTGEMVEGMDGMKEGDYIHGWGISLGGCVSNFMFNFEKNKEARAIPMALAEADPWSIPTMIRPESCSSGGESNAMAMMSQGKPFLGVALDGQSVNNVVAGSPAEAAGVQKGDKLLAVNDKEIEDLGTLASFMGDRKPGDEVVIHFERNGERNKKTVKLADRAELETRNAPDGKPLPSLTGKDIDGKEVKVADLKGKVIMLDFWATWCGPCVEEMPLMQLTWENLKDKGLVWVGASGDQDDDAWRDFVKTNHLGGIQLREESWLGALSINSFPTVLMVDKGGMVTCRARGGNVAQIAATLLQD